MGSNPSARTTLLFREPDGTILAYRTAGLRHTLARSDQRLSALCIRTYAALKVRRSVHLIVLLGQFRVRVNIDHRGFDEGMAQLIFDRQKMRPAMQKVGAKLCRSK